MRGQPMSSQLRWRFRHFDLYTAREWHAMLKLRASIFVVEQGCPYLDPDSKDPECWHLEAFLDGSLVGGMRIVPPGISYAEVSIGRVVIANEYRGLGWGRELMIRGIACSRSLWPNTGIRISGQGYLQEFYHSLDFVTVAGPYLEDDLPHFEMLLD